MGSGIGLIVRLLVPQPQGVGPPWNDLDLTAQTSGQTDEVHGTNWQSHIMLISVMHDLLTVVFNDNQ